MRTVVVSDLHLGVGGRDVALRTEPRRRLLEAISGCERLVLLGDVLELRGRPIGDVLESSLPFFDEVGEALGGADVVVVPGNHDHQLAAPWLERRRLGSRRSGDVAIQTTVKPGRATALARIAARLGRSQLELAYPGLMLRDDVYATHGHYLDVHMTVPRLECLAVRLMRRVAAGRNGVPRSAAEYEAVLGPLYGLAFGLAQVPRPRPRPRVTDESRPGPSTRVWSYLNDDSRNQIGRVVLGRAAIPAAVGALNLAGLGPFGTDLSGAELRRAGLRAMGDVISALGIEAEHVVFGHTHRPGPLDGDEASDWAPRDGIRLHNSGSWIYEQALVEGTRPRSPYWPGTCVVLEDERPPAVRALLDDVEASELTDPS